MMSGHLLPLQEGVMELLQSCEGGALNAASAGQPESGMQCVDCRLAVARLSLVLEQVMHDLERLTNAQLREGARRFLSMCEAKT